MCFIGEQRENLCSFQYKHMKTEFTTKLVYNRNKINYKTKYKSNFNTIFMELKRSTTIHNRLSMHNGIFD